MEPPYTNPSRDDLTTQADIESNNQGGGMTKRHARFHKIPIPFRNGYLASDFLKMITFISTALCIFQFFWIKHLQAGLVRIPNDIFDNTFWGLDRKSPSIWEESRQYFISKAVPVPIHSHNDYWRRIPLFEALGSGCISVEADVHLHNSDLLIGHNSGSNKDDTLRSMYLDPLQRMLELRNVDSPSGQPRGIFDRAPHQTVVLLIDAKGDGPSTIAELDAQLQPLRDLDYLTYWNGTARIMRPLTVVASGNVSFETIISLNGTHRDIFWDAALHRLSSISDDPTASPPVYTYNISNSYYASTEWKNARLFHAEKPHGTEPSDAWLKEAEMSQIEQAEARGLVARYWGTPEGPPNLRDVAWRVQMQQGVGILNMDDLGEVRARAGGWGRVEL